MELWDVYDADRNKVGRTHARGVPMAAGDYHLVVHVWIQNAKGEYLISKRTPNKTWPNLWECTGGSAIEGDDSLTAALREVREELGIELDPLNGDLIKTIRDVDAFDDVWLFRQDVDLGDIALQPDETCDAKWAAPGDIRAMCADGSFVPVFSYLEWLFDYREPLAFFPTESPARLGFAITAARHRGQWVLVRHRERDTWEFPGGHVEPGEDPVDAARRELMEESGAIDFALWPVCADSVARGDDVASGQLCFADIARFSDLSDEFEMAERAFVGALPDNLTYPYLIHKHVARAERWIAERATSAYFIRHAESDQSVHQDDIRPLTERGLRDAELLPNAFEGIRLDAIYSSPYLRAEQTVLPLAKRRHLPIGEVPDFRERKVGEGWIDDFDSFARRQWADLEYKLDGGESIAEAQRRNIAALNAILARRGGQAIAIGTHGGCLGAILNHYDPSFGYEQFLDLLPKLPCVMKLTFIDQRCVGMEEI